jgi:glycosyltransferase involved in cell wall biosynthesis
MRSTNRRIGIAQDRSQSPLVSILVVAFQDRVEVGRLLQNLVPFRSKEVELIVIDGGSRDGTLELLAANAGHIDYWSSEQDTGIYDAMNKAVRASRGVFLLHVNAGDSLIRLPLERLRVVAEQSVDVVCFRVLEDDSHLFCPRNDWMLRFDNTWHHQGTFYKRASHLGYDTNYKVFGDFDHNQRLRKSGCQVLLFDDIVAGHSTAGISSSAAQRAELYRSIRKNFGLLHLGPAFIRFKLLQARRWMRTRI